MYLIEPLSDSTEGDHAFYKQEDLKRSTEEPEITAYDREPRVAGLFKPSSLVRLGKIFSARGGVDLKLLQVVTSN